MKENLKSAWPMQIEKSKYTKQGGGRWKMTGKIT